MRKFIILLVLTTIFNCAPEELITEELYASTTLIAKGNLLGAGSEGIDQQNMIITNTAEWVSLINKISNTTATFSETEIDFTNYIIIAVFDEVKLGSGYSIELDVTYNSDAIIVTIENHSVNGDLTTRFTQPFHIIKINHSELPIIFQP